MSVDQRMPATPGRRRNVGFLSTRQALNAFAPSTGYSGGGGGGSAVVPAGDLQVPPIREMKASGAMLTSDKMSLILGPALLILVLVSLVGAQQLLFERSCCAAIGVEYIE